MPSARFVFAFVILGFALVFSLVVLWIKTQRFLKESELSPQQKKKLDSILGFVAVACILFGFLCGVFPYWSAGMQGSNLTAPGHFALAPSAMTER